MDAPAAHHNPMEPHRNERTWVVPAASAGPALAQHPDEQFNEIFARLPSHRDRALGRLLGLAFAGPGDRVPPWAARSCATGRHGPGSAMAIPAPAVWLWIVFDERWVAFDH